MRYGSYLRVTVTNGNSSDAAINLAPGFEMQCKVFVVRCLLPIEFTGTLLAHVLAEPIREIPGDR